MTVRKWLTVLLIVLPLAIGAWVARDLFGPDLRTLSPRLHVDGDALVGTLSIDNALGPDRLLGASSPEARVEVVTPDQPLPLPIPAGASVELDPGGAHLRLTGLEGEATVGRLVLLTLDFEKAGERRMRARIVEPPEAMHGREGKAGEGGPSLSLAAEPDARGGWDVRLETRGFRFLGPDELVVEPDAGHAHLYVGGLKLGRLYQPSGRVPPLPPGRHVLRATLNRADHALCIADGAPVEARLTIGE